MAKKTDFEIESEELLSGPPSGRVAFLEKAAKDGTVLQRAGAREIREPEGGGDNRQLAFVTSDETVDSYGDIIRARGWDLAHYRDNPLFLWMHNSRGLPIGRSVEHAIDRNQRKLRQTFEFFGPGVGDLDGDHARFADTIYKLYRGWTDKATKRTVRGLSATSVGFLPKPKGIKAPKDDAEREKLGLGPYGVVFEKQWLKETSGVTVPANPSALITNSYGTLLVHDVLSDDDLEVLEAFGLRREWLCELRQQVRAGTYVPGSECPWEFPGGSCEELADRALEELGDDFLEDEEDDEEEAPDATVRIIFDGEEEHEFSVPAGKTGTLRIDRASRSISPEGEARELDRRDIRRIIDSAIIALTTIAETLEDEPEDGDEPRAAEAGSISSALRELPELVRSLRAPVGAPSEEDPLDVILAAGGE